MRKRLVALVSVLALLGIPIPAQATAFSCSHPNQGIHVYLTVNPIIGSRKAHAISTLSNGDKRVQYWTKSSWVDPTWDDAGIVIANC